MLLYREYSKDKYELMSESWKWLKFHCREKGVYLLILEPMPMVSEGKSKEIKKGEEKLTIRYGLARGMGKTWVDRIMALSQDRGRSANGGYENNKNIYLPVCR